MFTVKWTPTADQEYKALLEAAKKSVAARASDPKKKPSKQEGLFKQVHKSIEYLKANPKHPSLKTHEYDSIPHPWDAKEKVWEAYAQNNTPGAYRIFWCYGPGKKEITIIAITPHP